MATGSWLRHDVWFESKIANIEYVKRSAIFRESNLLDI